MPCLRLYLFAATLLLSMAASLPLSTQTLPIVMTASDTPTTTGIPNKGGEGFRFLGFRLEPRPPTFAKETPLAG